MRVGHRSRWTPEEDGQLLHLLAKGASVTLISAKLKRSSQSIRMRLITLQKSDVKARKKKLPSEAASGSFSFAKRAD